MLVVVLFQAVTRYGESQLKPPPRIGGRYVSTAALPGCPAASRAVLTVLQSGLFLNGSLHLEEGAAIANPSPTQAQATDPHATDPHATDPHATAGTTAQAAQLSLVGRWQYQKVTLAGQTIALQTCQAVAATATAATATPQQVQIEGTVVQPSAPTQSSQQPRFVGQIQWSPTAPPLPFQGERLPEVPVLGH